MKQHTSLLDQTIDRLSGADLASTRHALFTHQMAWAPRLLSKCSLSAGTVDLGSSHSF